MVLTSLDLVVDILQSESIHFLKVFNIEVSFCIIVIAFVFEFILPSATINPRKYALSSVSIFSK
jgi:hypothetical protein